MRTHIKNIVIFFHPMAGMQVASGRFSTATGEAEVTRLESEVSFLQVKATMSLKERIRQVKAEICDNRRQIAHVRLESLAGAENPYSLMQVFGRGHQITKNGATVYVTKCQPVEVVPRQHTDCTNEIPVTFNETEVFVDPISLVIKTAAAPVRCNDIAPPRWKLGGKWYFYEQILQVPVYGIFQPKTGELDVYCLVAGKYEQQLKAWSLCAPKTFKSIMQRQQILRLDSSQVAAGLLALPLAAF